MLLCTALLQCLLLQCLQAAPSTDVLMAVTSRPALLHLERNGLPTRSIQIDPLGTVASVRRAAALSYGHEVFLEYRTRDGLMASVM